MEPITRLEIPVQGMDCAECQMHVQKAIASVSGVQSVDVFLASEKAVVLLNPEQADLTSIRAAVQSAGYHVPENQTGNAETENQFVRTVWRLLGMVFGVVLLVVVVGEWLGVIERITENIPWFIGLSIVLVGGYPVFRNVVRAALRGQIIAHTLMTLGVIAALIVGEWATAAVVVLFMRVGDYVEHFTAERARRAVKDLTALAPQTARVVRGGEETEITVDQVGVGDLVIIRPGEVVPVDGQVIQGQATVDQSTVTGESVPVEVGPGSRVFAATLVSLGALQIRATHVAAESTFGRVIRLVEEAEANRGQVQQFADRFSAYYLPIVVVVAALTFVIRRDPLATVAVLVVACSCAFALATPIAMLASIGAGARSGLMIKGGKYLEILARADMILLDKTGTLTLGKPKITDIKVIDTDRLAGSSGTDVNHKLLFYAASAERFSEHPLAEAVRIAALRNGVSLSEPKNFRAFPGFGVRAEVENRVVTVGKQQMLLDAGINFPEGFNEFEEQGKTVLYIALDDVLVGVLAAADVLRAEVPQAIQELHELGVGSIELLTGDREKAASILIAELVGQTGGSIPIRCRSELLPDDKIAVVKEYQKNGHTVVMVGDGVNDAPALAQADVGIAMGAAGHDVAIEAAHIALMRDDWSLIPQAFRIARRTMRVVRGNIIFTGLYNLIGLTLAAMGYLPPVLAAAAQSLPDLGILANSSRLLRGK